MNISTRGEMNVNACFTTNDFKKFLSRILLALSFFLLVNYSANGQTIFDWFDTAPDGNWRRGADGARWTGGLWDEPGFGVLRFNNNHQLSMTNNVAGTYSQHSIIFGSSNTSNRTINGNGSGNTVRFYDNGGTDPKIENQSSGSHTINFNIEGDGITDPLEMNPTSGNLTFGGTVNNQGTDILVYGNNGKTITYGGVISGSGKFIIKQNSIAVFNASNTYTGNTELDAGELWIGTSGGIASGSAIYLGNGSALSTVTKFWLSTSSGGTTFARNITVNNGNSTTRYIGGLNSSGTHTYSGNITNNSTGGLYLAAETSGGTVAFSGVISGSNPVLTSGSGTVTISGASANTYSGATTIGVATILNKSAGVVAIPSATTINSGITLRTDAANQWGTGTPPLVTIAGNGILNLNNTNQKIKLASSSSTAKVTLGSGTLTIDNTASDTYAGSISETGGLTKSNTGTLILTGTNTYTGATTVSAGTLQLNKSGGTTIPITNNVTVSGGTLKISQNQTLANLTATSGTITVDNGATLTITGKLTLSLGVTVSGNISYGAGADLELTSSGTTDDATWPATGGPANVIVNASGATITLHANRSVSGSITLTAGKLALSNYNLTVGSVSGGGASSYIQTAGTGTLTVNGINNDSGALIPVGNSTYNPVTIANTSSHNWTLKVTDAMTAPAPFNTNANAAIQRTWSITPSTNPTTATGITLQFDETDGNQKPAGFNINDPVQAFKRTTTSWFRIGSPGSLGGASGAKTFTITGVTSFSDFGLSNSGNPLPVNFTNLSGNIRNGKALLSWNIADEVNVAHYVLEESTDGRRFLPLTQIDAVSRSSYQASDAQLHLGANYYRVKAVDIDGKLTYSKIIRLDNSAVDNNIRVYPNPSQGELTLGLNIAAGNYQIRVINSIGQTVYQQSLTHEGGSRSLPLALPKLNAGIYQVEVSGGLEKFVRSVRIE
ncbi:MAG: autotransporter-associated beta strand repeat-containing protein [Bacteroidota bacterium]